MDANIGFFTFLYYRYLLFGAWLRSFTPIGGFFLVVKVIRMCPCFLLVISGTLIPFRWSTFIFYNAKIKTISKALISQSLDSILVSQVRSSLMSYGQWSGQLKQFMGTTRHDSPKRQFTWGIHSIGAPLARLVDISSAALLYEWVPNINSHKSQNSYWFLKFNFKLLILQSLKQEKQLNWFFLFKVLITRNIY